MSAGIASTGEQVGTRFNIVSAIPTTVLIVFVAAVLLSGPPEQAPDISKAGRALGSLSVVDLVLVILGLALGLLTHPLQRALIQVLEGYWAPVGALAVAAERGRERYRERVRVLDGLRTAQGAITRREARYPWLIEQRQDRAQEQRKDLPDDLDHIMPTRLGNVLRRAEVLAGARYGMDALEVIPRLYPVAPAAMVDMIEDARNQMEVAARFVLVWLVATAFSLAVFAPYGPWLMVPLVTYAMAYLSYRGAISAARSYGDQLMIAIDLYRFDLIKQLHYALPPDHMTEVELNSRITRVITGEDYLTRDDEDDESKQLVDQSPPSYQHPDANSHTRLNPRLFSRVASALWRRFRGQ